MSPSIFYDKGVLLMMVAELQAGNDNNDAIAAKLVVKHGKSVDDWNKGLKEYKHHIKKTCKEMAEGQAELTFFKKITWTKQEQNVMICLGQKLLETERVPSPRGKCTNSQSSEPVSPSNQKEVTPRTPAVSSLATKAQVAVANAAAKKSNRKQTSPSLPAADSTKSVAEATAVSPPVEDDAMTTQKPLEKFDAFISYNWGAEHANHRIVKEFRDVLGSQKLKVWFDDERILYGDVPEKVLDGMEASTCVIIVLSDDYIKRINTGDDKRGCKLEFTQWRTVYSRYKEAVFVVSDATVLHKDGGFDVDKYGGVFTAFAGTQRYYDISPGNPDRKLEMLKVANVIRTIIAESKF